MKKFEYLLIDPAYLTDNKFSEAMLDLNKSKSTLTVDNTEIIVLRNEIGDVSFGEIELKTSDLQFKMPGNDSGSHIIIPWATGEKLIDDRIRNCPDLFLKIETPTPIQEDQLEIIY